MKIKKNWTENLLNFTLGKQDERERLQTMSRLSVVVVCAYWFSVVVTIGSYVFDWEVGKNAIFIWLILSCFLVGGKKINDLSDATLPENTPIHSQNAARIQKQALRVACVKGALIALAIYAVIVSQNSQYAWGMVFFALLMGAIIVWALYVSAKQSIQKNLLETDD